MASEPAEIVSFLERLSNSSSRSRSRDLSLFIPFFLGIPDQASPQEDEPDPDADSADGDDPPRDRIIIINPFTQGMIVIEGSSGVDSLLREMQSKEGQPPASRASVEALPEVEIAEGCGGECVVCLEEWEVGGFVKEMPCKHRFHGSCIDKWLGIHGSCPVCRYEMPVEDEDLDNKREGENRGDASDGEGRGGRRPRREIWVSFGVSDGSRRSGDSSDHIEASTESNDSD